MTVITLYHHAGFRSSYELDAEDVSLIARAPSRLASYLQPGDGGFPLGDFAGLRQLLAGEVNTRRAKARARLQRLRAAKLPPLPPSKDPMPLPPRARRESRYIEVPGKGGRYCCYEGDGLWTLRMPGGGILKTTRSAVSDADAIAWASEPDDLYTARLAEWFGNSSYRAAIRENGGFLGPPSLTIVVPRQV